MLLYIHSPKGLLGTPDHRRSGDCGGHFSTVNSLSCSRKQFEM